MNDIDEIVEHSLNMHNKYVESRRIDFSKDMDHMVFDDGSEWWRVGHNASHYFYVGVMADGSYGRASWGDPFEDSDWNEEPSEIGDEGYIGHY